MSCYVQDMLADLSRVSATMQDVAGIVGRLPETRGDEDNDDKCQFSVFYYLSLLFGVRPS